MKSQSDQGDRSQEGQDQTRSTRSWIPIGYRPYVVGGILVGGVFGACVASFVVDPLILGIWPNFTRDLVESLLIVLGVVLGSLAGVFFYPEPLQLLPRNVEATARTYFVPSTPADGKENTEDRIKQPGG